MPTTSLDLSVRPTVFLDIDDVLALGIPYDESHVRLAAVDPVAAPKDLYERLFAKSAVDTLNVLIDEFNPSFVLTTSWLAFFQRDQFLRIFAMTGLHIADGGLHAQWSTPQGDDISRFDAISRWLEVHHRGEPILILDDPISGEGLVNSLWADSGRVVLCTRRTGLNPSHLELARDALARPFDGKRPWLC